MSLTIFEKIQKNLQGQKIDPEHVEERFIFMSMLNDMDWTKKGQSEICLSNSEKVRDFAKKKKFPRGHWSFLGPGDEEKMVRNAHLQT